MPTPLSNITQDSADTSAKNSPITIDALGDSTTFGWDHGQQSAKNMINTAQGLLGDKVKINNMGVSSTTLGDLLGTDNFKSVLKNSNPIAILNYGMNEAYRGESPETFKANLMSAIKQLQDAGKKVILQTPNKPNTTEGWEGNVGDYAKIISDVAGQTNSSLDDKYNTPITYASDDTIHPDEAGYGVLGKNLSSTIDSLISSPSFQSAAATGTQANSVENLYRDVLGREPDAEGLAYWKQQFGNEVDANEKSVFTNTAQNLLDSNPELYAAMAPKLTPKTATGLLSSAATNAATSATTPLSEIAQAAPAVTAPMAGIPLSNITQSLAATPAVDQVAPQAQAQAQAQSMEVAPQAQAQAQAQSMQVAPQQTAAQTQPVAQTAAAQTAAQGPAVKDITGNIIGYQSSQGAPGAVQVQTGQNRDGPVYSWLTPPSGQYATQLQTGTDRNGNPIYNGQMVITPQAQQAQGQATAATFTEPAWVANARQTIGTGVEPVYPTVNKRNGIAVEDPSQAPIGYRYDNGQSQYVYLDLAGKPTGTVESRGSGIGSQLLNMGQTLAPLALTALGANFLAPALGDLFGPSVSDLFGGGGAADLGAGAGSAGASINEMVASGLTPGSVGAAGAAAGALTPEALAAAAETAGTTLSDFAAAGTNATTGTISPASINQAVAAGTFTPGALANVAAANGLTTDQLISALSSSGALNAAAGTTLADLASAGTTQLTPAAIDSLTGTAGYGTNASAVQAAIDAGINPAIVGSGALGTTADLLAGTTGAIETTPGAASLNEMIASGMSPGSAGAYGAASGALTGAGLAAASGTGLADLAGLGTTALTPAAIDSLTGTAGYGTNASAVQAAIDAGINPAIVGSGAGLSVADLLANTTGAGAGLTPAAALLNEMVASGLTPGSAGAANAATGALTGLDLAGAAGTGLTNLAALGTGAGLGATTGLTPAATTALTPAATTALTPAAIESLAGTAGYGTNASAVNAAIQAGINPAIVGAGAAGTTANLLAGTTGAAATTPAAASINQMVASGTAPGSVGATGAATGALTGANLAGAGGLATTGSNLTNLGSTAATGANTSLMQQLQAATGLSGPQLASLLSGGIGAINASNISGAIGQGLAAQQAANAQSQGVLKDIYNQQLGFQKPYQQTGLTGLNQLGQLADTGYLTHQFNAQDLAAGLAPNYDFMLQQGQMANQRAANVGGGALSGNTMQGLQNYTQNYAGNAYQNAFNNYQSQRNNIYTNLANMAGIGQTANTGAQAAGTAYSKGTTDLNTALANAQAAATLGQAQAGAAGTTGLANSTFLASLLGQTGTIPT